jgi:hypothetical protein
MSTYYLHDGRNELGPFTLEELKKQVLTRNTPLRQKDTNNWLPAEKLTELKPLLVPKKIRRPKDIVPVVTERVIDLHQRKPVILYGTALCAALLAGLSFYTVGRSSASVVVPQAVGATKLVAVPLPTKVVAATELSIAAAPKVIKPSAEDEAKATRLRWRKLISAANSNYGIGFLGGIKDLNVIITNRTAYPIDQAVAKVTYIKANGEVWKTKLITLYSIPPHESKEQPVPDVGRGKKAKVSIQKVVSKKMKFSYTEGQPIKNTEDPYVL